jgi:hypothetical protein
MKEIFDPPAIVRGAEDLETLAQQINAREEQGVRALLEHARAQGEDLARAKKVAGHGKWLKWLEKNVSFDRRTATNYMLIAAKWETVSHLKKIRDALKLLSEGKEEPEQPPVYSEKLERWLRFVQGETLVIEVEEGGIGKMLEEPEKWDWTRVRESILPDLHTLRDRLNHYLEEIKKYATHEGNGDPSA